MILDAFIFAWPIWDVFKKTFSDTKGLVRFLNCVFLNFLEKDSSFATGYSENFGQNPPFVKRLLFFSPLSKENV